jgi:hypothetical protein
MAALGGAIGSGNLTTAQSAFATVQGDLKNVPSQAVTNAETAVVQTVQWVDDLLSLSSSNSSTSAPVDPATAMLDSAYGLSTSSASADATSILDSVYGAGATGTSPTAAASTTSLNSSGNTGSGASVNVYA